MKKISLNSNGNGFKLRQFEDNLKWFDKITKYDIKQAESNLNSCLS